MKAKLALLAVGVLALVFAGCAAQAVPGATVTDDGNLMFQAKGYSVPAKADDLLSVEEAKVAAATIAKANLLELVKGALVSQNVTVEGLMFESEAAASMVEGFLSRATVAYEKEEGRFVSPAICAVATLVLTEDEYCALADYVE